MLVDEQLVEKRRGLGMFVGEGAARKLAVIEKERFLNEEWPLVAGKINRLGLDPDFLLAQMERDE